MRVLTDTHSLVWALSDPEFLSPGALQALTESEVNASVVNLWELILKTRKKDALLSDPVPWWEKFVIKAGIPVFSIRAAHVLELGRLPEFHKDPFDRILIAQSRVEKTPLVSKDSRLARYGIPIIW